MQRATRLLATLGRPDPEQIEALLDGVEYDRLLETASQVPVAELIAVAFSNQLAVNDFWQTATREQRAKVRGCSMQLLALAVDQTLMLHRCDNELAERTAAQEAARNKLPTLMTRAAMQCQQARDILLKVGAEGARPRLDQPDVSESARPVQALAILAELGASMIQGAPQRVAMRAMLYGLDKAFIDGLERLSTEVRICEQSANAGVLTESQRKVMNRALVATWLLTTHFSEAFAIGHKLDADIPALRGLEKVKPILKESPKQEDGARPVAMPAYAAQNGPYSAGHNGQHSPTHVALRPSPLSIPRISGKG